jgi:hypothetical protein
MRSRLRKNWEQGGQLLSNDSRRIDVRRNRSRRRGTANAGGSSADMHHGMSQEERESTRGSREEEELQLSLYRRSQRSSSPETDLNVFDSEATDDALRRSLRCRRARNTLQRKSESGSSMDYGEVVRVPHRWCMLACWVLGAGTFVTLSIDAGTTHARGSFMYSRS